MSEIAPKAATVRTVWKFPIVLNDVVRVMMPSRSEILKIDVQGDLPCIWALVDPSAVLAERRFRLAGTGHSLDQNVGPYLGTFFMHGGALVFHLFELYEVVEAMSARPLTPIFHIRVEIGHGTKITFEDNSRRVWACGCYEDQGGYHFCAKLAERQVPDNAVRCLNSHGHARCIHLAGHLPPCDWEIGP